MRKIALITGSSRGIGAETARRLSKDGFDVCINYLNSSQAAERLAAELSTPDRKVIAVKADVSIETDVIHLFDEIDRRLGPLTCLVNNAGILMQQMRVEAMSAERINRMLTTNVTSYFLCARQAIFRMSKKHGGKGGTIINVSSAAGRLGSAGEYVDYAASKGAIDTFTKGLALELADEGIRVNGVRPGFIHTEMHADGGEPGRVERMIPQLPLGRGGEPVEVAAAIAWLASEESSYTTGAFIEVTGGR